MILCEDLSFHFAHKLLHTKLLYPYIHKIHHDYKATVSISADYQHPLEFYLSGVLPSSLGPLLLGRIIHPSTVMLFGFLRTIESIDGHCGYEFPWSPFRLIPLSASSTYHRFHHTHNVGNYSSFLTFWDTVLGHNAEFYKHHEKKENAENTIKND